MDPRSFYGLGFHEWAGLIIGIFFILHKVLNISLIILTVVIVVTGVIAFVNIRYWESSVRVFQLNGDQLTGRDGRRGFDERERFERSDGENRDYEFRERRDIPDSLRTETTDESNFRTLSDSLRQRGRHDDFRGERGSFRGGHNGDRRGGDFHGGSNVILGKVTGFLAVFALFTLITTGFDKALKIFNNRNKSV